MQPLLIIITGRPGTGKTTLAHRLSADLGIPAFCKDECKEKLFDRLGWSDQEWSQKLSLAAYHVMDYVIESNLSCNTNLIIESNFLHKFDSERIAGLAMKHGAKIVQIVLHADEQVRAERYNRRNAENRHPGHHTRDIYHMNPANGRYEPLDVPGDLVELDVTDFSTFDYSALLTTLRA